MLGSIVVFSKKTAVLAAYLVNTFLQLAFLQYRTGFYVRYQGPLFLIFMYSYWLVQQPDNRPEKQVQGSLARLFERPFFRIVRMAVSPFMTAVLSVQFAAGIFCYAQDVRYPFSASAEAARYMKEQRLEDLIIVGQTDFITQPISGYLNRKIYYPQKGDFGTHVIWMDSSRKNTVSVDGILLSAIGLYQSSGKNVLLVMHTPLRDEQQNPLRDMHIFDGIGLKYLKEFTVTIVPDEKYYLYLMYGGA